MKMNTLFGVHNKFLPNLMRYTALVAMSLVVMTANAKEKARVVDCDKPNGPTINKAIKKAKEGDVIKIVGACIENVQLNKGVTLDGEGIASISPEDETIATITVTARNAVITGLSLESIKPSAQVLVSDLSLLTIENNQIGNSELAAIDVYGSSMVTILGNHIHGSGTGIQATETSTIRVGYDTAPLDPAKANLIENNNIGIVIARAFGNIAGNSINNNIRFGVVVSRSGSARVASNEIAGNLIGLINTTNGTLDQVLEGNAIFGQSNTGINNFEGFRCISGYASTSSTSTFGPTNIFPNCLYEVEVPSP